ncbi:hypothetical protein CY34DRAFT_807166 [Suillus luteus UH-Slu-Lm8-n1]|uniref:Uncharacterized protein n=1 Tax=Suillus luteus UH-Slu-Lm8-n1 TaxID=930992 RepID=A0A0D0BA27_9AGAM|nr:hypothetical protein CY34DRAFT_807166 [Suillus luteus UH-Slu-Lm8-n1]
MTFCPHLSVSAAWYISRFSFGRLALHEFRKISTVSWTNNSCPTSLIALPPLKMLDAA